MRRAQDRGKPISRLDPSDPADQAHVEVSGEEIGGNRGKPGKSRHIVEQEDARLGERRSLLGAWDLGELEQHVMPRRRGAGKLLGQCRLYATGGDKLARLERDLIQAIHIRALCRCGCLTSHAGW